MVWNRYPLQALQKIIDSKKHVSLDFHANNKEIDMCILILNKCI